MKKDELTTLGLTDEQADKVLALAGKDIEKQKQKISALETERDDLNARLQTAEETLKGFDGKSADEVRSEIEKYKQQAAEAEKNLQAQMTQRDQRDWIKGRLDEYGVSSPFARRQLMSDVMDEKEGLKWKDGVFQGFDDFMKAAKEKDAGLYQTAEEKEAAAKQEQLEKRAPRFTGPAGNGGQQQETKYTPPKLF